MKLRYNILWLDDQIEEFMEDGFVDQIKEFLDNEGFEYNIKTLSCADDFFACLSDQWDLILTDYNMEGMNGAEVITKIRGKQIFTEILFYTAQKSWESLDKIDRISFVQTAGIVSGNHHEIVTREAMRLIALTIKKFQDIVAMRGMIMHETSSLDAQINSLVQSYLACESESNCDMCQNKEQCKSIADTVIPQMEAHLNQKLKITSKRDFKKIRKDNFLYSADYKRIVLGKLLKLHGIKDFSSNYKDDIITIRNKFAHAVLLSDEHGQSYFENKDEDLKFDDTLCKEIRKNIRKYKKLIDEASVTILNKE